MASSRRILGGRPTTLRHCSRSWPRRPVPGGGRHGAPSAAASRTFGIQRVVAGEPRLICVWNPTTLKLACHLVPRYYLKALVLRDTATLCDGMIGIGKVVGWL